MRYAFYPGCVSRGAAPELFQSTMEVCAKLGIELEFEPMRSASCTGSGVLQEKNLRLGDTLNARNFALAERTGLPPAEHLQHVPGSNVPGERAPHLRSRLPCLNQRGPRRGGPRIQRHRRSQAPHVGDSRGRWTRQAQVAGRQASHRIQGRALLRLLHRQAHVGPRIRRASRAGRLAGAGHRGRRRRGGRLPPARPSAAAFPSSPSTSPTP